MELFTQNYIENYRIYFNSPNVVETADKIFEAIKNGNELLNDNEKIASIILTYIKLDEHYNKK